MSNLASLKRKFDGGVFVLASGGSAKKFPLSDYKNKRFICVNGSILALLKKNIIPFAYVFNDESFLINSMDLVLKGIRVSNYVFLPKELYYKYIEENITDARDRSKIYFIERVNRSLGDKGASDRVFSLKNILNKDYVNSFSLFSNKKNRIGFSLNLESGYFCARTIPYVALQLAYYLGFKKVFLIGLDLNSETGRFYDNKNSLPSYIDQHYDGFILPSFELMSKRVTNNDFKVFNLSGNSRLPNSIVKKITIEDLWGLLDE